MEKYGEYRDSGTGIGPFLPVLVPATVKPGVGGKIVLYLKVIVKVVVGFPIVLIYQVLPLGFLLDFLFKILVGFKLSVQVEGIKKTKVDPLQDYPQKNGLYYCNYTNPLDFWFLSKISGKQKMVVLIAFSKNQAIEFQHGAWWNFALFTLMTSGILPPKASGKGRGFEIIKLDKNTLKDRYSDQIVYCFPEGTTSNGKSVLPFEMDCKILENSCKFQSINTINMKLLPSYLVTPLPYDAMDTTKYWMKLLTYSSLNSGIECRYKICRNVNSADVRVKLNNDDKYKLIGASLNKNKKSKFTEIYKGPI